MEKTDLQSYLKAAKLDLMEQIEKEPMTLHEVRRIQDISRMIDPLVSYWATPREHEGVRTAVSDSQDKAPHLHAALKERAFDGDELLKSKFETMSEEHRNLKRTKLDLEDAASRIAVEDAHITAQKETLDQYREVLTRERERLQLSSDTQGAGVVIPQLPAITNPNPDAEDAGIPAQTTTDIEAELLEDPDGDEKEDDAG